MTDQHPLETPPNYLDPAFGSSEEATLLRGILRLRRSISTQMQDKFRRLLPLSELLSDRWERARHLGFGDGSSIYESSYVYGEVVVGKNCWIGPFTILDGSGSRLQIGDWCDISAGVQIYTHDTVTRSLTLGTAAPEYAPVTIGSGCYIGPNAVIAKGVSIGDHSAIGAQSFVNRSVPPYSLAVGAPCRVTARVIVDGASVRFERIGAEP
jgi:acetyltransferase-like isoleucine patch superfamily enzyme